MFEKYLYSFIANVVVWRVLWKRLHLKTYKLSIVQDVERWIDRQPPPNILTFPMTNHLISSDEKLCSSSNTSATTHFGCLQIVYYVDYEKQWTLLQPKQKATSPATWDPYEVYIWISVWLQQLVNITWELWIVQTYITVSFTYSAAGMFHTLIRVSTKFRA
jgi:hypothetical protein